MDRKSGHWEGIVIQDHGSGVASEESANPAAPEMTARQNQLGTR
jgi:hypothetical protein